MKGGEAEAGPAIFYSVNVRGLMVDVTGSFEGNLKSDAVERVRYKKRKSWSSEIKCFKVLKQNIFMFLYDFYRMIAKLSFFYVMGEQIVLMRYDSWNISC